jgi:hypothetical protein
LCSSAGIKRWNIWVARAFIAAQARERRTCQDANRLQKGTTHIRRKALGIV